MRWMVWIESHLQIKVWGVRVKGKGKARRLNDPNDLELAEWRWGGELDGTMCVVVGSRRVFRWGRLANGVKWQKRSELKQRKGHKATQCK